VASSTIALKSNLASWVVLANVAPRLSSYVVLL
jgi:hypothetical protein